MVDIDSQNALAGLRRWKLVRDDESDPGGRIYVDAYGKQYASVTRILSATSPPEQKLALERWLARPGSEANRTQAAMRGTLTHNHAEYLLKTSAKLSRNAANRRNAWKTCPDGLERHSRHLTAWALDKAIQGAPSPAWSAAGFCRGLRHWIADNVTAIHSIEFSVHHPAGFAGSCDGLLDVNGVLSTVDWKTSQASVHQSPEQKDARLLNYKDQLGGYALGLHHLTGIQVPQAVIVLARRTGAPEITVLDGYQLREAEERFLERCEQYFSAPKAPFI